MQKEIIDKAVNVLDQLMDGEIAIEDASNLMDVFKSAITVENEAELRPIVEQMQEYVDKQ